MMISTEAWVLHKGDGSSGRGRLVLERIDFPELAEDEVLVRPIYGCWEANLDHAIQRSPLDICVARDEERVVLGNAGVVQVVRTGSAVADLEKGQLCIVFCNGTADANGYPSQILAYDAPRTMGVLAKTSKLHHRQLIPIPAGSPFSLPQWAAFSLRYVTAWANWRVAYACWQSQMTDTAPDETCVVGWGGGVSMAELTLAKLKGCRTAMIASTQARLDQIRDLGMQAIDRAELVQGRSDSAFLAQLHGCTDGRGADIFVDNIGAHFRTTLKGLARQGVVTTSGWKHGVTFPLIRSAECIGRHIHVFTHYARYAEGLAAVRFANEHAWMPALHGPVCAWDDIPQLADAYAQGRVDDYFPIFSINPIETA